MRVYIESYGCSQNRGEGAALAREVASGGHEVVAAPEGADVGVLVSCAVIGSTESRMVRRWRELVDITPRVVVTGCLVPLRTGLIDGPGRERTSFLPIREQAHLPSWLDAWAVDAPPEPRPATGPAALPMLAPPEHPRTAAEEVVIAQGCTSACSYCFSRLARGRLESVDLPAVLRQVAAAVARGAAEIRLTSPDTAAYGADRAAGPRLPELVRAVGELPGEFRIRVGMMSPQTIGPLLDPYLRAMALSPAYRFLHLPVQSGSDRVLASMRRGYTISDFRGQVARARESFPELHLATDLIVGYPEESEDDFDASVHLLEEVRPETVNVTRFSPRPGTPAAHRPPVPTTRAMRRSRALTAVRRSIARDRLERLVGEELPGHVTEYGPHGSAVARLDNYLPVVLSRRPPLGARLPLRIDGARSTYLLGRPVGSFK